MTGERTLLAFCSRLIEEGDTLIDNFGGQWRALGKARYTTIGGERIKAIACCPAGQRGDAGWDLRPVDDFRYGNRIPRGAT